MSVDQDDVLALTRAALADLDDTSHGLTRAYRKASRIAGLRNDYRALYWILMDTRSSEDETARFRAFSEVAPHLDKDEMRRLHDSTVEDYVVIRKATKIEDGALDKNAVCALSVEELEAMIVQLSAPLTPQPPKAGMHPYDVAYFHDKARGEQIGRSFLLGQYISVRARLADRLLSYLTRVEKAILLGRPTSDIFATNRAYLDRILPQRAPAVAEQLRAAEARVQDKTVEGRTHALTSCRRALKSLADSLYPPCSTPAVAEDGREHSLTDDKWINRLWQYLSEQVGSDPARQLLRQDLAEITARIDHLNDLASKGVHDAVTDYEAHICLSRTTLIIGDFFRIAEGSSALLLGRGSLRDVPGTATSERAV